MKKLMLALVALVGAWSVSAQNEVIELYNTGVEALQAKNYAEAVKLLEQVVDEGLNYEDDTVLGLVANAKKYIPVGYQRLGTRAASAKNYDEAITMLTTAAERAELYGDMQAMNKSNVILAQVYQVKGGEAFNSKDYATAAEVFQKGYDANPRNTDMALNLAMSYCELGDLDKGVAIYDAVCAMNPTKYAEAIAKAQEMKALYTNNEIARLQLDNNYDGIIALAEKILSQNPYDAIALKAQLQAYNSKEDYDKVIELADEAAAAQIDDDNRSQIYYILGAAYNAKEMKPQAIEALKKVTSGANLEAAKATIVELSK